MEGTYNNRFSPIKVYCTNHNVTTETCYYNYNRSVSGVKCCQHFHRDSRGGQPRDWRRTNSARNWRNSVLKIWDRKCALSGKNEKEASLVCHHFFNTNYGGNYAFNTKNDIVFLKEIHEGFHSMYGFTNNSLDQFIEYISKQKNKDNSRLRQLSKVENLEKMEQWLKSNSKNISKSLSIVFLLINCFFKLENL